MTTEDQNPTLLTVLEAFWARKTAGLHTATPGQIVKYDSKTRFATVKPLIKFQFKDEQIPREMPNLQDVPVLMPGTASGCIHLPGLEGAYGIIIYAENSIEEWISGAGNSMFPADPRKFDLSDAFFIPGIYPELMPYMGDIDESVMDISVMPGTKIRIGNGVTELVTLFDELLTLLQGSVDSPGTSSSGTLSKIIVDLATIQSKIATIKS